MKVISFNRVVGLTSYHNGQKIEDHFNPGQRYVIDDELGNQLNTGNPDVIEEFREFRRHPLPEDCAGQRILFYIFPCGGGYGDQLMAGSLSRYFSEVKKAKPYQICHRLFEEVWKSNPYITGRPLLFPMALDSLFRAPAEGEIFFDGAVFVEKEEYTEPENTYDQLFRRSGVDPKSVDDKYKRPVFTLKQADMAARDNWLKEMGIGAHYVVQLQTGLNGVARALPIDLVKRVLAAVKKAASKRQATILCVNDRAFDPQVADCIRKVPNAINVAGTLSTSIYAALIASAKLVIGPDSSAIHFAAAFNTPALGLWGLFPPYFRTHYYKNQIHLFHRDASSISNDPKAQIQIAHKVLSSIPSEEIEDSIKDLLAINEKERA